MLFVCVEPDLAERVYLSLTLRVCVCVKPCVCLLLAFQVSNVYQCVTMYVLKYMAKSMFVCLCMSVVMCGSGGHALHMVWPSIFFI